MIPTSHLIFLAEAGISDAIEEPFLESQESEKCGNTKPDCVNMNFFFFSITFNSLYVASDCDLLENNRGRDPHKMWRTDDDESLGGSNCSAFMRS